MRGNLSRLLMWREAGGAYVSTVVRGGYTITARCESTTFAEGPCRVDGLAQLLQFGGWYRSVRGIDRGEVCGIADLLPRTSRVVPTSLLAVLAGDAHKGGGVSPPLDGTQGWQDAHLLATSAIGAAWANGRAGNRGSPGRVGCHLARQCGFAGPADYWAAGATAVVRSAARAGGNDRGSRGPSTAGATPTFRTGQVHQRVLSLYHDPKGELCFC
jgi:hypothetical protein